MLKYLKWMLVTLIELRSAKNLKQIKLFLEQENQRYYSAKLIRFQLV
jgi:hypothetical protein